MSRVMIIEDNIKQRKYIVACARAINPAIEIYETGSGIEACKILTSKDIDAFFIDIQLEDYNGIDLAKEIRKIKHYQFSPIVFITGVASREVMAFHEVHCYDYIIKPFSEEKLKEVLKSILIDYVNQTIEEEANLEIEYKGIGQIINVSDILFVEVKSRKISITTKYEEIQYKHMPLTTFIRKLPECFVQVHQSFAINSNYIEKCDYVQKIIKLKGNNTCIPIGIKYTHMLKEYINEGN